MKRTNTYLFLSFFLLFLTLVSCVENKSKVGKSIFHGTQGNGVADQSFDLDQIQQTGELIALTIYGPTTYYEVQGEYFGLQYKIIDAYAKSIGVSLRVDVCRDSVELSRKLLRGDGDVVVTAAPDSVLGIDVVPIRFPAVGEVKAGFWQVRATSPLLSESLTSWLSDNKDNLLAIATPRISDGRGHYYAPRRPRPSAPIRNLAKGEISVYDNLFRKYGSLCGWDWRLLAAQSYQESAFDPQAVSWMGALGLMQLMPATARSVGVMPDQAFDPETNIRGAARLITQLDQHYSFIHSMDERINFILAAYNAGSGHVDDARRLTQRDGHNPNQWFGSVDRYVLRMSEPRYYNDTLVHHGYFRGSETYQYVADIRARWQEYRSKIK